MEEFETESSLDELARLCDELGLDHMDSEACACETHIFIDAEGNPHECWEASPGHINVTVAMTPEQAVHITDFEKLREQLQDAEHEESMAWDRVRKAERQIEGLREVVDGLREYIAGNADDCDFCPQLATCENHPAPPPCKYELTTKDHAVLDFIADCLSELGVPE